MPTDFFPRARPFLAGLTADVSLIRADLAYTLIDGENSDWQSYAYAGWSETKRSQARALWRSIGMTHVWVNFALRYPNAGMDFDYRSDPAHFARCLDELRFDGLVPVVSTAQGETYGLHEDFDQMRCLDDIAHWPQWGWAPRIDFAFTGPESNDFLRPWDVIYLARALRSVLPEAWIGIHPGRVPGEGLLYQGYGDPGDADYWDRERFWWELREAVPTKLAFLWEASEETLQHPHPREELYTRLMGMRVRLEGPCPLPAQFPFAPYLDTMPFRTNGGTEPDDWTKSGPINGGRCADLYAYWEGPAYLRWASARKADLSRVALLVPGVTGVGDGVP